MTGVDVRKLSQHQLREMIGYVPQKGMLFSGTVASNLRYGKEDATGQELQAALATAQRRGLCKRHGRRGGFPPSPRGAPTSPAASGSGCPLPAPWPARRPSISLTTASSALDFKTDAALRKALARDTQNATVLIVAQRVSTILHAQQIIVLDQGKMVGKGTHKELLQTCPEYREIAESQLQKEELE